MIFSYLIHAPTPSGLAHERRLAVLCLLSGFATGVGCALGLTLLFFLFS